MNDLVFFFHFFLLAVYTIKERYSLCWTFECLKWFEWCSRLYEHKFCHNQYKTPSEYPWMRIFKFARVIYSNKEKITIFLVDLHDSPIHERISPRREINKLTYFPWVMFVPKCCSFASEMTKWNKFITMLRENECLIRCIR